ncbi:putative protein phosphatase 2C 1 [Drosera capensis]
MGACVSTSGSPRDCSSCEDGDDDRSSSACCRIRKKRSRRFVDRSVTLQQQLSSIPNRVFANGKGRTSCVFTQQGRKGVNQDAMIAWEDFMAEDVTFCGVFDGHGPHGHLVARKVRDSLPLKLLSFLNSEQIKPVETDAGCCDATPKLDTVDSEKDVLVDDKLCTWREAFLKSFKAMDKELKSHPNVDCFCSGSTAVTVVKQGLNLFLGNIGDSRAIMGSKASDGSLVAAQLTVDLKPDLPKEAERINRCKGRVFALQDEPEVSRVWLPYDDAPGILTEKDLFVVLASDGIWDVLSNEEVVEIVSSAGSRSSAARTVVESATREWKTEYPTSKIDDCAVVCLFLDGKMDSESDIDSATIQSRHSGAPPDPEDGPEPILLRNATVRSSDGDDQLRVLSEEVEGKGKAVAAEEQDWSGLEGITRVNSLVQLPRFTEDRPESKSSP